MLVAIAARTMADTQTVTWLERFKTEEMDDARSASL
jgi:hypothetical protein